jgi:glutaredoxin
LDDAGYWDLSNIHAMINRRAKMKKSMLLSAIMILLFVAGVFLFETESSAADKNLVKSTENAPKVEIYITSWSPLCKRAIRFLKTKGVQYVAYDIAKDKDAAKRKDALDSEKGVPFALINGEKIHGFSAEGYSAALNLNANQVTSDEEDTQEEVGADEEITPDEEDTQEEVAPDEEDTQEEVAPDEEDIQEEVAPDEEDIQEEVTQDEEDAQEEITPDEKDTQEEDNQ